MAKQKKRTTKPKNETLTAERNHVANGSSAETAQQRLQQVQMQERQLRKKLIKITLKSGIIIRTTNPEQFKHLFPPMIPNNKKPNPPPQKQAKKTTHNP